MSEEGTAAAAVVDGAEENVDLVSEEMEMTLIEMCEKNRKEARIR